MKKQKLFIFMSFCIVPIGGMEMHMYGMSEYLEKHGWKVFIFTPEPPQLKTVIPALQKYLEVGGGFTFLMTPPYKNVGLLQNIGLNTMVERLQQCFGNLDEYDIVIESCESIRSFWAELLAARIGARHIFMASEENFRLGACLYENNLDFYYFKFKRNELIGYPTNIKNLFNGYKDVNESVNEDAPLYLAEPEPIKDVPDFPIEKLKEADWNIAHIGRMMKAFVAHVIIGVAEFARRHPDKKINFILVGQIIPDRANLMKEKFAGLDNLTIIPLGDMIPIPRSLFSKIDVVCAMAGAALYSAREGVPVIVGNSNKIDKTSGVLGVDTKETIYSDEKLFDYPEALENVLVKKLYEGKKFELPHVDPAEKSYANIWKVLENVAPDKEYFAEKLSRERIRNQAMIFPFGYIARGARIILVGATEFAKDYKRQIESQNNASLEFGKKYIKQMTGEPYAEIVATLDEHPEEFDNSVLGLERLQKRDYDVILLSTYPENTQSVFNKITQLVPDMANRIVYNHQTVQI